MTTKSKLIAFIWNYRYLHLLMLPGLIFLILFKYFPMYGIIVAFKNYKGNGGFDAIMASPWVGFKFFSIFINSIYFNRLMINTLLISFYRLIFSFPAPIILAILLNEIKNKKFKKITQTVVYMPHFLSWVIAASLVSTILSYTDGPVNEIIEMLGFERISFLGNKNLFRGVLVVSDIWKTVGWGTIVYLAAISGIDIQLYEAAKMDGASRFQQIIHITLPSIRSIITILLILRVGRIMDENFEQIFNLYNPVVYAVSDVFETFTYRQGIIKAQYSYTAAVGVFKSIIALIIVMTTNKVVTAMGETGLW